MRVTDFTRRALAFRRERRDMEASGWLIVSEPYWQIVRGGDRRRIVEAKASVNGTSIWFKLSDDKRA